MSIHSLLRCAAVPAGLTLLLGGALAADAPPATTPAVVAPAVVAPAVVSPAVTAAAPARARPDFSGSWQLDPKASDDPAMIPGGGERGQGGPGSGGGRGPGSRGRGPTADPNQGTMPGEGFDGSDAPERDRDEAAGRQSAREFGQLEIFHAGDEFDLTDGMQVSRMLTIGGQPTEVFTPRGPAKATAAWDNDALLVTESDPQGQVRRTRQFQMSSDGGTLTVREIRHRPGKDGNHTMTMVYRRRADSGRP
jgi:hypothetical protein